MLSLSKKSNLTVSRDASARSYRSQRSGDSSRSRMTAGGEESDEEGLEEETEGYSDEDESTYSTSGSFYGDDESGEGQEKSEGPEDRLKIILEHRK